MHQKKLKIDGLSFVLFIALFIWANYMAFFVSERWEDSYAYLLSAQSSMNSGYGAFFGRLQHPFYTVNLYVFTKIFGDAFVGAKILALVSYAITMIFVYRISRIYGSRTVAILPVFFCSIVALDYLNYSLAVLSGPLFIAILMAGFYYILRYKYAKAALLIGMLSLIRAEYILVFISLLIVLTVLRGRKHVLILSLVNIPFLAIFMLLLNMAPTAGKEVIERFGNRSIFEVSYQTLTKFSHTLFGGQLINSGITFFIIFISAGIAGSYLWKIGRKRLEADKNMDVFLFSLLFLLLNMAALILLNYLGKHPLAVRHLGYLVPFLSLCFIFVIVKYEERILPFWLAKFNVGTISLLAMMSLLIFMPHSSNPDGRFFSLVHWVDESKHTGLWLAENVVSNERIISVLPSPLFFSGLNSSQWQMHYPVNILDRDSYFKESIKYVVWSNIYAGQNLIALDKLGGLSTGNDFIFFKNVYTPPNSKAWNSIIYSIGENDSIVGGLNYNAKLGAGWYGQEQLVRWASKKTSVVKIFSIEDQTLTLEFYAGAFRKKAMLQVKVNGRDYASYKVALKKGDNTTPTKITMTLDVSAGTTMIELIGPQETFKPIDVGGWRDSRELRMVYSCMLIKQTDGKAIRVF